MYWLCFSTSEINLRAFEVHEKLDISNIDAAIFEFNSGYLASYGGSYMSVHVLFNLLCLGKNDKMRGLPSILTLFRNEFM